MLDDMNVTPVPPVDPDPAIGEPVEEPVQEGPYTQFDWGFQTRIPPVDGIPVQYVEYMPYFINIVALNGSGTVQISERPDFLIGSEYLDKPYHLNSASISSAERSATVLFMISQCRSSDKFRIVFKFIDDSNGEVTYVPFENLEAITEDPFFPYYGVRLTWEKNDNAQNYFIKAVEPEIKNEEAEKYCRCCHKPKAPSSNGTQTTNRPNHRREREFCIPHDYHSTSKYQWFIDRWGTPHTLYTIMAKTDTGAECDRSLPRHAPEYLEDFCLIQGTIADISGEPSVSIPISYRIKDPNHIDNTFIRKGTNLIYTDERGYFEITVPKQCILQLVIDDACFNRSLVIPKVDHIDIKDLLKLPQNLPGGNYVQTR